MCWDLHLLIIAGAAAFYAVAWGSYSPAHSAVEYTIGTYEEITTGIFYKLTGALTSNRQQILSADINTLAEGMVLDLPVAHRRGADPLRHRGLCGADVADEPVLDDRPVGRPVDRLAADPGALDAPWRQAHLSRR